MKKFNFRLDSVLRLRQLELGVEKEKLQRILTEITRFERTLAALAGERSAAQDFVQKQASAGSTELRSLSAFLMGVDTRATTLRTNIERGRKLFEEQRQRVITVERSERLLLKLKDKRLVEWQLEGDRELEALAQEAWNAGHRFKNRPPDS